MTGITREIAQKVLDTVDAGLVVGVGRAVPGQMCVEAAVCYAMGLPHSDAPPCVSLTLRALKVILNDASWSSVQARANGLRELALVQLGSVGYLDEKEFSRRVVMLVVNKYLPLLLRKAFLNKEAAFCERVLTLSEAHSAALNAHVAAINNMSLRDVTFYAVEATSLPAHYSRIATESKLLAYKFSEQGHKISYSAAKFSEQGHKISAADIAIAIDMVDYATRAIRSMVPRFGSVEDDKVLLSFAEDIVDILIEMEVPGVQWLDLIE